MGDVGGPMLGADGGATTVAVLEGWLQTGLPIPLSSTTKHVYCDPGGSPVSVPWSGVVPTGTVVVTTAGAVPVAVQD